LEFWDNVLGGNQPRDATSSGYNQNDNALFTSTTKEVNPMFCVDQYSLYIVNEWGDNAGDATDLLQGEDVIAKNIKDSTVIVSNLLPNLEKLEDQASNGVNPTISGFPAIYNAYAPSWMQPPSGVTIYQSQFSSAIFCRNRTLLRYQWTLAGPPTPLSTPTNTSGYLPIASLWGSQSLLVGEEKPAETSVHFMRSIGF